MPRIRGKIRSYKGDTTGWAWTLDYVDHRGKRHQHKYDGTRKSAQTQIERILLKEWALDAQLIASITEITVKRGETLYTKYLNRRKRSQGTITRYRFAFNALYTAIGEQTLLHTVTEHDLEALENSRLKRISEVSFKTELRHYRAFFNWAKKHDYIRKSPFDKYDFDNDSRPEQQKRVLTAEEVIKILVESLKIEIEAFHVILMYLANGFRLSELTHENFKWDWVSFERRQFQHIDVKSRHPKKVITKQMSELTYRILAIRRLLSPIAPFAFKADYYANHYVEPALERAGLKGASAKTLRSTAAGHVYLQTGDIYAAQSFLQHSSVQLTAESYVGLLNMEKYDSPIGLRDIFEVCLQHSNTNGCNWDQLSAEEEAKLCANITSALEALLLKTQKDTA